MAHDRDKGGPCALPDGHRGFHRSPEAYARQLERHPEVQARYEVRHPVQRALTVIRQVASQRGNR